MEAEVLQRLEAMDTKIDQLIGMVHELQVVMPDQHQVLIERMTDVRATEAAILTEVVAQQGKRRRPTIKE